MENVVFLELMRRGYTLRVGSFKDTDVDFTDTREREFRPLESIRDNWRKTIITLDRLGLGSENGIRVVNLYDWLLEKT